MAPSILHLTLSLTLFSISLAIPSSRQVADSSQQAAYDRTDIIGTYQLGTEQSTSCSESVTIRKVTRLASGMFKIPHSAISEHGENCTGNGYMLILRRDSRNGMRGDELSKSTKVSTVVDALVESGINFFLGVEQQGRLCGDMQTPASTIVLFLREKEGTRLIGTFDLFSSKFKYMIVYKPGLETPCTYSSPVKYEKDPDADLNIVEPLEPAAPSNTPVKNPVATVTAAIPTVSSSPVSQTPPFVSVAPSPSATATVSPSPLTSHHDGHNVNDEDDEMAMSPFEDDGPACFPGDASVVLEGGSTKRMDNLSVGDRVMVGFQEFAPVFMFTHRDSGATSNFVRLVTAGARIIYLTPGHYLYVNRRLIAATRVRTGDIVQTGAGNDVVMTVSRVLKTGLYNPQTTHGDIIVNGVRASTYTMTVERKAAHALLMPLRALFRCTGYSTSFFNGGADRSAKFMPSGGVVV